MALTSNIRGEETGCDGSNNRTIRSDDTTNEHDEAEEMGGQR